MGIFFRSRKPVINGKELHKDFDATNIIGNMAISKDGRYAAVTSSGDLIVSPIPEDGKIEVDGTVVNYKNDGKGNQFTQVSNFSGGSLIVSGSCVVMSGKGAGLGKEFNPLLVLKELFLV